MALSVKQLLELKNKSEWQDWRWQWQNRITELSQLLERPAKYNTQELLMPFGVTPHYLSLADFSDSECPIIRQFMPSSEEQTDGEFSTLDPFDEVGQEILPRLVQRFTGRVLWQVANRCAVYCRFCMRKQMFLRKDAFRNNNDLDVLEHISGAEDISEVILSGGDPLVLGNHRLKKIITGLRAIRHLKSIRIHTRIPVTMPMRIDPELLAIFRENYPLTLVTHFNHQCEISVESAAAIRLMRMNGVAVLNQAVLLRTVNDSVFELERLHMGLIEIGVQPYYLHQCDRVRGNAHFYVEPEQGMALVKEFADRNPGIAVPRYVIDLPGAESKQLMVNDMNRCRITDQSQ